LAVITISSKVIVISPGLIYRVVDIRFPQNPFYELEMPIRCELFIYHVDRLIERNTRELRKSRSLASES